MFGKGQKSRVIPLRGRLVLEIERYCWKPLPLLGRTPEPDDFCSTRRSEREAGAFSPRTRSGA